MGNEESTSSDSDLHGSSQQSRILEAKNLRSVAKYMKSEECQVVYVMVRLVSLQNFHNAQNFMHSPQTHPHPVILPSRYRGIT
jgi:hypothetical protein